MNGCEIWVTIYVKNSMKFLFWKFLFWKLRNIQKIVLKNCFVAFWGHFNLAKLNFQFLFNFLNFQYGVFLIILLVLEIVVFVFAFAYQDVVSNYLKKW